MELSAVMPFMPLTGAHYWAESVIFLDSLMNIDSVHSKKKRSTSQVLPCVKPFIMENYHLDKQLGALCLAPSGCLQASSGFLFDGNNLIRFRGACQLKIKSCQGRTCNLLSECLLARLPHLEYIRVGFRAFKSPPI